MTSVTDIDRDALMRGPDGELYEVYGFILDPAVILGRVRDGVRDFVIPTAPNWKEWRVVDPADAQAELLSLLRENRP